MVKRLVVIASLSALTLVGCGSSDSSSGRTTATNPPGVASASAAVTAPPGGSSDGGASQSPGTSPDSSSTTPSGAVDIPQMGIRLTVPHGISYVSYQLSGSPGGNPPITRVARLDVTLSSGVKCADVGAIDQLTSDPGQTAGGPQVLHVGSQFFAIDQANGAPATGCEGAHDLVRTILTGIQPISGR